MSTFSVNVAKNQMSGRSFCAQVFLWSTVNWFISPCSDSSISYAVTDDSLLALIFTELVRNNILLPRYKTYSETVLISEAYLDIHS